jgi:hypothetical protein
MNESSVTRRHEKRSTSGVACGRKGPIAVITYGFHFLCGRLRFSEVLDNPFRGYLPYSEVIFSAVRTRLRKKSPTHNVQLWLQ